MWKRIFKDNSGSELVTEQQVRRRLTGYYKNVDLAIEAAIRGQDVDTPHSIYRFTPDKEAAA